MQKVKKFDRINRYEIQIMRSESVYYSYSAAQWLLVFYLYCMLGWCFESTVVSVGQRRLVNRGFLRGPMLPIYGFGA